MKQQLTEALAMLEGRDYLTPQDLVEREFRSWLEVTAAARLVERLLPGECRHGYLVDLARVECPVCHGSGQVWDEGIVEAVKDALRKAWAGPMTELYLLEGVEIVLDAGARAVLSALVELLTEKVEK